MAFVTGKTEGAKMTNAHGSEMASEKRDFGDSSCTLGFTSPCVNLRCPEHGHLKHPQPFIVKDDGRVYWNPAVTNAKLAAEFTEKEKSVYEEAARKVKDAEGEFVPPPYIPFSERMPRPPQPTCKYWHAITMDGIRYEWGADTMVELQEMLAAHRKRNLSK